MSRCKPLCKFLNMDPIKELFLHSRLMIYLVAD